MHLNNYKPHKLKLYILVSLSILVLFSCSAHKNVVFYEKVLGDYNISGCYISIRLDSCGVQKLYIVENSNLRSYLYRNQYVEFEKYREKMLNILKKDSVVVNSNPDWDFTKVPVILEVEKNAAKGIEDFLKIYFVNDIVLKDGLTDEEEAAIINQLFKWRIACTRDCETGILIIVRI